jgi:PAS domain S-box-containing protein
MAMLRLVAAAQSPQKIVLVLIPLQRGSSMSSDIDDTIRTVLNDGLAGQLDYYTEYLDVARFPEPDYQLAVRDFFRRKYARQTFDLVIATTDVTLEFVNAYRDELFPAAAVVSGVSSPQANLSTPRAGPRATGVVLPVDLKRTIDVAIQLQPDLRDVFVVSGASDTDRGYQDLARAQFRAFDGRIRFTYSSGLAIQDLLRRVSALPQHTIVYFLTFFEDGHNSTFDELKALDQVAAVANVPTYVWIDTRMGHGSVGGSVFSVERAAGAVANVALRVLKGESPQSIPVREIDAHITQFDWRQLRRFGISETRLPAGSLVRFREPSLWDQYKFYVVAATGVLLWQTGLIAGLLVQRVRRRRVEGALRESEERFRLMADTAPVLVWRSDVDKACDFFNQPFLQFRGRTMEQELGDGWTEGVHSADLERYLATYNQAFDERRPFRVEYRLRRADDEYRWMLDSGIPRFASDGAFAGYIGSCIDITERQRAEAELRESEASLRKSHSENQELAGRLITAQEVERARIARELHDDVGQRLASFSIALGTLRRRLPGAPQPVHDELAGLQRETVTLGNDLRLLSHELHPALLEHLGLVDALRRRCEEVSAESGVTVALDVTSEFGQVPDEVALCLYRVAQEALRNVVNHAQARSARVELSRENGRVAMRIADDGRGFEPGTAAGRRGLGLISLDERVRMLAGTLGIESAPHIGTIVSVTVPFGDPDATATSPRRG